tara:strand:+ start:1354 stop:1842 length:489 start_codon:yes stop_codon:yes gene_type:complete
MKILSFTNSDELKEIKIKKTDNILNELSIIDKRAIKNIHTWYHDNITLECYGYDKNDLNDKINIHNLPPTENEILLYGDLYLVYKINNVISDLDISQYGMLTFYIEERFDNLESLETDNYISSEEETDEIETKKDKNFKINKVKKENTEDFKDELDYDVYKY